MDNARTIIGVNPAGAEPVMRQSERKVNEPFAGYKDFADCVAQNSDKDDPAAYCHSIETQTEENAPPEHPDAPLTGPVKDTSTIVPDMGVEPDKSTPPKLDILQPEGAPETLPDEEQPHVDAGTDPEKTGVTSVRLGEEPVEQEGELCPEGEHRDENGICVPDTLEQYADIPNTPLIPCDPGYYHNSQGICIPDEPVEQDLPPCPEGQHRDAAGKCVPDVDVSGSQVRAIKAEYAADGLRSNIKMIEATWVNKYTALNDGYMKLMGRAGKLEELIRQQRTEINNAGTRTEDLRVELRGVKQQFADATTSNTKFSRLIETLRVEKDDAETKYRNGLTTNLELSRKLTRANEDYLEIHKRLEQAQVAFKRARNEAKKIVKIKA